MANGMIEECYVYTDKYHRVRIGLPDGKTFREVSRNGSGWITKKPPGPTPLYHADRLPVRGLILVVEGEKCVHAAEKIGMVATTSGGCTSANGADWRPLAGRDVAILPDNDNIGAKYAADICAQLRKLDPSPTVRVVNLPGLESGGDIADFIDWRDSQTSEEIVAEIATLIDNAVAVDLAACQPEQATTEPPTIKTDLVWCNTIKPEKIDWLWLNRLERGELNLMAGDPGISKSLLTAAVASTITTGAPWPDSRAEWSRKPGSVIFVTAEDKPSKATVPRLMAAGADMSKTAVIRQVQAGEEDKRQFNLYHDLPALERDLDAIPDVELVVIDPVNSYLVGSNSNSNEEMRRILEPLADVAERYNVAVLCLMHLNKSVATLNAMYRIAGSMAFVALPRTVHILTKDPDDKQRTLFCPLKISHGPKPDTLSYTVEIDQDNQPVIAWDAKPTNIDADDALQSKHPGPHPIKKTRAVEWLRDQLSNGPMPSKDLDAAADAVGITLGTLRNAKEELGVVAVQVRDGQKVAGWQVALSEGGCPNDP
ncbi:MAG: AAA family ATPase [Planctomycetota bacterium]